MPRTPRPLNPQPQASSCATPNKRKRDDNDREDEVRDSNNNESRLVTIWVGGAPVNNATAFLPCTSWTIERAKLVSTSGYFRTELAKFANKPELELPLIIINNNDAFELWIRWVHGGNVHAELGNKPNEHRILVMYTVRRLLNAYLLGIQLEDPSFQDAIINVINKNVHKVLPFTKDMVAYLYMRTAKGSPLRKLLVSPTISHGTFDWDQQTLYPGDFITELGAAVWERGKNERRIEEVRNRSEPCYFHHHGPDVICASWSEPSRPGTPQSPEIRYLPTSPASD